MCGIIGHLRVDGKDSNIVCQKALALLQYRGYDSCGVAGMKNGKIRSFKRVGKVHQLKEFTTPLDICIGHTRWATHGEITNENAHPHSSEDNKLYIAHNGIIENYLELKEKLDSSYVSETDSEVIAHLLHKYYIGSLADAMQKVTKLLKGTFAIVAIHSDEPKTIVCASRAAPLIVGRCLTSKDIYVASDANALDNKSLDAFYLENDEIAELTEKKITVKNKFGVELLKKSATLLIQSEKQDKSGYDHFLLKEILEQPQTLRAAINGRIDKKNMTAIFEELSISDEMLKQCDHINIIACGSSYYTGCIAKQMLESMTRKHVSVEIASEFRYANPILTDKSLVIAISQSGETADTIASLQEAKKYTSKLIALCNVPGSTIARMIPNTLQLKAGPEISVCSTKAFTSQLMVLFLLSLKIGRLLNTTRSEGKIMIQNLEKMIPSMETVIHQKEEIEELAIKAANFKTAFYVGRQEMLHISQEAALKLKEISYIHAHGIAAGELKHGSIALITPETMTIALCGNSATLGKTESNMMEIKARQGPIFAFANEGDNQLTTITPDIVFLPKLDDLFSPFVYALATQLFAYYIAKKLDCDIDQPRNLAKSVTVE